jgi:hypothetical protein
MVFPHIGNTTVVDDIPAREEPTTFVCFAHFPLEEDRCAFISVESPPKYVEYPLFLFGFKDGEVRLAANFEDAMTEMCIFGNLVLKYGDLD